MIDIGADRQRAPATRAASRSRVPPLLVGGFALFLVAVGYLIVASLSRREAPTFEPTPAGSVRAGGGPRGDTVTVDARDSQTWRYFDFGSGTLLPAGPHTRWDVAFRRYHVLAADAVADLGPVAFADVRQAPASGFLPNTGGADSVNSAMRRWYRYSMVTHLLESTRHVYVVRTRSGQYAKLQILSYYCTGLSAGCVTFHYAYPLRGPPPAQTRP